MTWVESSSKQSITICAELSRVVDFLKDVTSCAKLMPGVRAVEQLEPGVLHYQLEEFSNGAISFAADYQARFDTSDPMHITWEPHGDHNFRSTGTFRAKPSGVDGEVILEIEVASSADVDIDPILQPMVEPFAQQSTEVVTEEYLRALKQHLELGG